MGNCKTLIYSGMVSREVQIKFLFANFIVCITQITSSLPRYCHLPHFCLFTIPLLKSAPPTTSRVQKWMNFNIEGEHTSWLEREREREGAIVAFITFPSSSRARPRPWWCTQRARPRPWWWCTLAGKEPDQPDAYSEPCQEDSCRGGIFIWFVSFLVFSQQSWEDEIWGKNQWSSSKALKHPWICQRERVASVFHRFNPPNQPFHLRLNKSTTASQLTFESLFHSSQRTRLISKNTIIIMIPTFVTPWHYIACNIKQTINILKANFTPLKLIQNCKLLSWLHHLSPRGTVQARDGGLLEEVQREEEAERSHLDHHACLKELLKYVAFIVNLNNIY